jgi:hypothetical protein
VVRECSVIDQVSVVFETGNLVTDRFFNIGNNVVNDITNFVASVRPAQTKALCDISIDLKSVLAIEFKVVYYSIF